MRDEPCSPPPCVNYRQERGQKTSIWTNVMLDDMSSGTEINCILLNDYCVCLNRLKTATVRRHDAWPRIGASCARSNPTAHGVSAGTLNPEHRCHTPAEAPQHNGRTSRGRDFGRMQPTGIVVPHPSLRRPPRKLATRDRAPVPRPLIIYLYIGRDYRITRVLDAHGMHGQANRLAHPPRRGC